MRRAVDSLIDRSLNYGRHCILDYLRRSMPYRRVLDIGAGRGADLLLARAVNPTAELFAVEPVSQHVDHLRELGISVACLNIERDALISQPDFYDTIIMNQILEHTKEVFWIMHEVSRTLAVGGHLIVGIPNLAALHNRVLLMLGQQPSPLKTASAHVRGFTRSDFLRFLEECFPGGYSLLGFRGSNFYPFPPILARPLARLLPSMAWSIFFLLKKTRPYRREFLEYPALNSLETNFYVGLP